MKYSRRCRLMPEPDRVDSAVEWFMDFVSGPAAEWFAGRDSIEKLVELAKTPNAGTIDNISPRRLRGIATLCVVNGRMDDAHSLMDWYIQRGKFNVLDSLERASAFDAALAMCFPTYRER
ncbi:hypothetical protein [Nocardia sp. NPDC127526]|uniref:hypothetical protein n=1 Tax=Nocardia sp. NPDC127526 TaxID=3345393 RepID=UPI0036267E54